MDDFNTNYIYTENNTSRADIIKVSKDKSLRLDKYAERLLNEGNIDCYCYFHFGKPLDEYHYGLLKQIGVSAFIGIESRLNNTVELLNFNATIEEINIVHKLLKLK